ncbi:MAG: TolC family outer membrane protein [Gammaproteobacteria bacterium]
MTKKNLPLLIAMLLAVSSSAHAENLLDAYRLAADSDPQVKAAEAAWQAVGETRNQRLALFRPQLSLNSNLTRNRQEFLSGGFFGRSGTFYSTNEGLTLNLNQPIYHRDYYVQLRQTDARTRQAEADYNAAQQALLLRVSERYFEVLAASDTVEFARAEKEAIGRQLEQMQRRFDVGLVAITDVNEAQARFDLAVSQEVDAQSRLSSNREALREVTGTLPESLRGLTEQIPLASPDPQNVETWVDTALKQNFQLISAQAATDVASQTIDLQRSGHYPVVDAVVSHGYSKFSGGAFGARETLDSAIGLQLSVPLYQGGAVNSRIREAQYRLNQAKETQEQQTRAASRQTRDSYLNVTSSISRVGALKQAVVSNQSALDATEAGMQVGTRTTIDVLNAQRDLFRAKRDLSRARYDYLINTLRLKQAAGMISLADLEQVNGWLK